MLSEGADAPGFELPALVDGEKRRVALAEYLGDDVVILAFYPGDFNPACDEESCDLDELDLFTMQKDVTILGISPDSLYSHGAFAEQYDLKIPLLSDTDGEVAERYDIGLVDDIGQRLVERAVAVVDHDGTITYSWSTDDMTELPRVEEIKDALAETGGDDTAFARYRVGHAHYTEGRRSFTSAMESFQNTEWVMAQHDFQQAREEFEEAADRFDTAVRFVDDDALVPIYEGANEKATALWQAADWLTRSASAYSSGSGTEGQELRDDAEIPLSTVREYREPPDPDGEWPPEMENLEKAESDDHSILPTEPDVEDAALDLDIDDADDEPTDAAPDTDTDESADPAEQVAATADGPDPEPAADDDIDDDELAEIQAELAANNPESEPSVEELTEESTSIVDTPPMGASDGETEAVEAADSETETAEAADSETEDSPSTIDPPATNESDGDTASADESEEPVDAMAEPADSDPAGERDVDAPAQGHEAETADGAAGDVAVAVEGLPTGESSEGPAVTADEQTDATAPDSAAMATDGSDGEAAGESDETDASESDGTDDGESDEADASESDGTDDGGPDLQLELAEPDADPIDGDGPPIPPADEPDGESGSDE
ncbi:redoxin domain-containing protein [Halomicroarcula sp. F28]|uniref:redoxin domain-containing protein n=1 Tax=Haloarcula salinisoli TaxID=2487746 RepID=UPI001C730C25|nr:peroxiredoxin [Halomicroarcula salinisoli]MBX0286925.1 redoxin domain-containing protein [Halomicroarcula salinisoli]